MIVPKIKKKVNAFLLGEDGTPDLDERGLVPMRYKPEDERTYTVRPDEVRDLPAEGDEAPAGPPEPIQVWADAATTPESSGIGVVLRWCDRTREIHRRLDPMPLPRAGITAVVEALEAIRRPSLPVHLRTPHVEAVNALRAGRRDGSDSPLADALRHAVRRFRSLKITDVDATNEPSDTARASELAREAIALSP